MNILKISSIFRRANVPVPQAGQNQEKTSQQRVEVQAGPGQGGTLPTLGNREEHVDNQEGAVGTAGSDASPQKSY